MAEMEKEVTQEEAVETTDKEAEAVTEAEVGENANAEEAEVVSDAEETEDAEESIEDDTEEDAEEKKGLFKRKEKKDKSAEQIAELNDRIKRQMAEFDNFRKRTEREKNQMYEIGAKSVIEKILPVVDNFERGLAAVPEESKEDGFVQGMNQIYKQLMTELEGIGVKPIEATGQTFDPDFHNAVMHVEDEAFGENVVAEELQKGYMYRDSVLRYSMVKVAN